MDKKEKIKESLSKLNAMLLPPLKVGGKRVLEFRVLVEVDEEVLQSMIKQPNIIYLDELIYVLEKSLETETKSATVRYGANNFRLPDWVDKIGRVECMIPKGFEV